MGRTAAARGGGSCGTSASAGPPAQRIRWSSAHGLRWLCGLFPKSNPPTPLNPAQQAGGSLRKPGCAAPSATSHAPLSPPARGEGAREG